MRILTLDNVSYNLNNLPDELEEDLRFSVLDNPDVNEPTLSNIFRVLVPLL